MIKTQAYFVEDSQRNTLDALTLCNDFFLYEDFTKLGFPAKSELIRIYTDAFNQELNQVDSVFIIFEDNFPIGCAVIENTIFGSENDPIYEINVYIDKDFRGNGFGDVLMKEVKLHYSNLIGNMYNEASAVFFTKHDVECNALFGSYQIHNNHFSYKREVA